jgi:lipid-binding SYLF domain-containing protein
MMVLTLSLIMAVATAGWATSAEQKEKIELAAAVLDEIMVIPEKGIPSNLLADAAGIAVVPNVIKVGFIFGGRHGTGVLLLRDESGRWSNPAFISLTGGSIGWQIGAQSTDVILVFKNRKSIDGIMEGKFTIGADAAAVAGPVGRRVEGATDSLLKAEIYSYSRSRGLFAGVSLEGSALQIDDAANSAYYGRQDITGRAILTGASGGATAEIDNLRSKLAAYANP